MPADFTSTGIIVVKDNLHVVKEVNNVVKDVVKEMDEMVMAIAQRDKVQIQPSGVTALNKLLLRLYGYAVILSS